MSWRTTVAVLAAWSVNVALHRFTADSAYLDLRIAQNLAQGLGWTWTGGPPPSDVSFSPLIVVIATAFESAGLAPNLALQGLGWLIGCGLLAHLLRSLVWLSVPQPIAVAGTVSLAIHPIMGAWATGGSVDLIRAAAIWGALWAWALGPGTLSWRWAPAPLLVFADPLGPVWWACALGLAAWQRIADGRVRDVPLPELSRRSTATLARPLLAPFVAGLVSVAVLVVLRHQVFGTALPWALLSSQPVHLGVLRPSVFSALTLVVPLFWIGWLLTAPGVLFRSVALVTLGTAALFASPEDPLGRAWVPAAIPGVVAACLWCARSWNAGQLARAVALPAALLACAPVTVIDLPVLPLGVRQTLDPRPQTPRTRSEREQWRVMRNHAADQVEVGRMLFERFGPGVLAVASPGARAWAWQGPVQDQSGRADPARYSLPSTPRSVPVLSVEQPVVLQARLYQGTRRQATRAAADMAYEGTVGEALAFDDDRWLLALRPNTTGTDATPLDVKPDLERLMRAGPSDGSHRELRAGGGLLAARPDAMGDHALLVTAGDRPAARLLSLRGEELHRWEIPWADAWPGEPPAGAPARYLRRAWMLPQGDLVALFEGMGLVRVNSNGRLVWRLKLPVHSDGVVLGDELIVAGRSAGEDILRHHLITVALKDGVVVDDWPLDEALADAGVPRGSAPDPAGLSGVSAHPRGGLLLSLRAAGALVRAWPEDRRIEQIAIPSNVRPQHALMSGELLVVEGPIDSSRTGGVWRRDGTGQWDQLTALRRPGEGSARLAAADPDTLWLTDSADGTIHGMNTSGEPVWTYLAPWRIRSGRRVAAVFQAEVVQPSEPIWLATP